MKPRNPRWRELLDIARSRADDRAMEHGGWVSSPGERSDVWSFVVGTVRVASWDAARGRFNWGDGPGGGFWLGVFDARLATMLGVTAVIQYQTRNREGQT